MNSRESHSFQPETQPHLFGADVPALTRQGSTEQPSSRQEVIERVYEAAEPEFIQMYRAFLMSYAERVEDFIAGEITHEFEERHGKLSVIEGKQLGGLYQSLQREGEIEKTGGYRARNQGNPSAIYRLKKHGEL